MQNDFDKLIDSFMQSGNGKNLNALKSILSTDKNREILSSVIGNGDELKKAVIDAKAGNTNSAKALLATLAATPGGAELISKIVMTLEGKSNG